MAADLAANCRADRQRARRRSNAGAAGRRGVPQPALRAADARPWPNSRSRSTRRDLIKEVSLFADRSDISEEIVRLRSHLEQFDDTLDLPESSGRKLDFLTQEMFRETNTIGSKANDVEIARHVIEIKTAIERIREMIQNIE